MLIESAQWPRTGSRMQINAVRTIKSFICSNVLCCHFFSLYNSVQFLSLLLRVVQVSSSALFLTLNGVVLFTVPLSPWWS